MILEIIEIASSNDRLKMIVKSLLNPWKDTVVCFKNAKDHRLNCIRSCQMRTYLKRYLCSRCHAFESVHNLDNAKYRAMKNLLHHLNTHFPTGGPKSFFEWIIRREEFIKDTLPVDSNCSTFKIESILEVCHEQVA